MFTLFNLIGAGLWAVAVGLAGFYLSDSIERVLGEIRHYEIEVMATIGIVGLVAWSLVILRRRRREKRLAARKESS